MNSWAGGLLRAAAAPAACAAVLIGLLSAWVSIGGAGTITRVRITVSLAAVPMTSFARPAGGRSATYLTIRNRAGQADQLIAASSPAARRATLTTGPVTIPARGVVTLTPFGADVTLADTGRLMAGQQVPLTLIFRHAGRVTVEARVTPPGTP